MSPVRHYDEMVRRLGLLLAQPQAQVDPSWAPMLATGLDISKGLLPVGEADQADPVWGSRLGVAVLHRVCGPVPALTDFDALPGRWCLLSREDRLARLAALGLVGTPGALRACVRRAPRQALEAVLGPAYEVLMTLGTGAAAAAPQVAERPPAAWALDAYLALSRAGRWKNRALRRWVRLGLPRAPCPDTSRIRPCPQAVQVCLQYLPSVDNWFQH
ncbi:type III secretion protein HrpB4 [Xylophilus ampelinus]|uniref:Type III secretion system (T3SS) protein HrpB4 n=1 Tax=Xylophilus ampelinus TaxID=54067 RepID=A0A318SL70_9BURK|nr:type III secretion protein HrpB4 [Xylophilus ampelinus]MCS4510414.1 type III secretion protein [Xylophilus ampelinus]PYE77868.1 type III secretion system (T3SS) protein HrpB4 [Xylophilus ampelinus]